MGRVGGRIAHPWAREEFAMSGSVGAKVKDPTGFVMGTAGQGAPVAGPRDCTEQPGNLDPDRGSLFPTWSKRGPS